MKSLLRFAPLAVLCLPLLSAFEKPAYAQTPRAFYAGNTASEKFNCVLELSNGTTLVGGSAQNLDWIAPSVPRVALAGTGINNAGRTGKIAFILQVSGDLGQIQRVLTLPLGAAEDIRWIKTTSRPGAATGSLYVSGTTLDSRANGGGYFVARLNNNFVSGVPSAFSWTKNIWATGDHQTIQPWDVGGDGKVVYASGQPFGYDWCGVYRLKADGSPDVVPNWRYHWTTENREVSGPLTSTAGIAYSGIIFKAQGRIDLRSWTQADYAAKISDGNGGTKQGKWPLDLFFSGPGNPASPGTSPGGPGYTGYRLGSNPTQRVGAISVDKTSGAIYIGFSIQSKLPSGSPDFEPAVIAYKSTGALLWWSRLYTETSQNSSPDQYIDGLAVDYANSRLVVLARCHGNNTYNFWNGSGSFHNGFTGTSGNIHISWLGKLSATTGALWKSCYVAEYTDGMEGTGAAYSDPNLDGWPNHNNGWPQLNTTRCTNQIGVDAAGRVYVAGIGRRTITTKNAFQKMLRKSEGISSWNSWARVYTPDLSGVLYSSCLTGVWDKTTGAGGDNTKILGLWPTTNGVLVAGMHLAENGVAKGNPIPVASVPSWGRSTPSGESAILARLPFTIPTATKTTTPVSANASGTSANSF